MNNEQFRRVELTPGLVYIDSEFSTLFVVVSVLYNDVSDRPRPNIAVLTVSEKGVVKLRPILDGPTFFLNSDIVLYDPGEDRG